MRYNSKETPQIVVKYPTGSTVNVDIIRIDGTDTVVVAGATMSEILGRGLFKYQFSTLDHVDYREYVWITTDGFVDQSGKFGQGGYIDDTLNTVQDNQALILSN